MSTATVTPQQDWFATNTPGVQSKGSSGDWFADNAPSQDQPGWLDRDIPLTSHGAATESGVQSVARGVRSAVKGTLSLLDPRPQNDEEQAALAGAGGNPASLPVYRILRSVGHTAQDATQIAGAIHDINQSSDPLGYYAKAAQATAGEGAGQALTALATEGLVRGVPAGVSAVKGALDSPVGEAAIAATKAVAKELPKAAIKRIPYVGKVAGDVADAAQQAYSASKGARVADEARAAAPVDEFEGVTSPQTESASETPSESEPEQQAEPEAAQQDTEPASNVDTSPKAVQGALEQALGVKKPVPGVPLKNQAAAQAVDAAKLPEGFTPVESSALKGFKYNPDTQELETIDAKTGTHYIHGDVSPEDFGQFASAESKGKAWNAIKANSPLVAKVVNGKRVPMVGSAKAAD